MVRVSLLRSGLFQTDADDRWKEADSVYRASHVQSHVVIVGVGVLDVGLEGDMVRYGPRFIRQP